jgi:periplasmic protein CpxP/Spy
MKRFAVVALFLAARVAFAQPSCGQGACCMNDRPERPGMELMKDLNLSDKQMEELQGLRAKFEKQMIETQSKIRLLRVDLRELASSEKPDRAAIEKKLGDISDLQLKEKLALVEHLFQARGILTPEQQKKFRGHLMGRLLNEGGMPPMFGGKNGQMRGGMRGRMHGDMMRHQEMMDHGRRDGHDPTPEPPQK